MESGISICPLLLKDMGQGIPETVTLLGAVISSSHLSTATTPRVPFVEDSVSEWQLLGKFFILNI